MDVILSTDEIDRLKKLLSNMTQSERNLVLSSESAFELWLSHALKWITDKAITVGIGVVMGILIEELFNSHS